MAQHDDDMEFERELDLDYVAEWVDAATRSAGEIINGNTVNPIQPRPRSPSCEMLETPPAAIPTILPMTDAQMTRCMRPITRLAKFDDANRAPIAVTAPTLHLAARAVIDILEYGNSSLPDARFECPDGVTVSDIRYCEPIGFLDIRTSYQV